MFAEHLRHLDQVIQERLSILTVIMKLDISDACRKLWLSMSRVPFSLYHHNVLI